MLARPPFKQTLFNGESSIFDLIPWLKIGALVRKLGSNGVMQSKMREQPTENVEVIFGRVTFKSLPLSSYINEAGFLGLKKKVWEGV